MTTTYAGRYDEVLIDRFGNGLARRPVTVTSVADGLNAILYADRFRSATVPNPVLTDNLGNLVFYAEPGEAAYVLHWTDRGTPQSYPISVPLDPGEIDNLVRTTDPRLSDARPMAAPSAPVDFAGQRAANLGDGVDPQDAATVGQLAASGSGAHDAKGGAVRVASNGNKVLSGEQTIDSVAVVTGDRVLLRRQTAGEENGIYVVAVGAWARATDADAASPTEVSPGLTVFVSEGALNAGSAWRLNTPDPITLGVTALTFGQVQSASAYSAGPGLSLTGSQFSVAFGTTTTTVPRGDDTRFSDARTPTAHAHAESDVTALTGDLAARELIANKGLADGYASLDATGKVPSSQLPAGGTPTSAAAISVAPVLNTGGVASVLADDAQEAMGELGRNVVSAEALKVGATPVAGLTGTGSTALSVANLNTALAALPRNTTVMFKADSYLRLDADTPVIVPAAARGLALRFNGATLYQPPTIHGAGSANRRDIEFVRVTGGAQDTEVSDLTVVAGAYDTMNGSSGDLSATTGNLFQTVLDSATGAYTKDEVGFEDAGTNGWSGVANTNVANPVNSPLSLEGAQALQLKNNTGGAVMTAQSRAIRARVLPTSTVTSQLSLASHQSNAFLASAKAATTANINIASAPGTVDGVALSSTNRLLVKNQTTATENGVYRHNGTGAALTRVTDADTGAELAKAVVLVREGTVNAETLWYQSTPGPITIGVTNIVWTSYVPPVTLKVVWYNNTTGTGTALRTDTGSATLIPPENEDVTGWTPWAVPTVTSGSPPLQTTTTASGTVSTVASVVPVASVAGFPAAGSFVLAGNTVVTYTAIAGSTFTGCTIAAGSLAYANGAAVSGAVTFRRVVEIGSAGSPTRQDDLFFVDRDMVWFNTARTPSTSGTERLLAWPNDEMRLDISGHSGVWWRSPYLNLADGAGTIVSTHNGATQGAPTAEPTYRNPDGRHAFDFKAWSTDATGGSGAPPTNSFQVRITDDEFPHNPSWIEFTFTLTAAPAWYRVIFAPKDLHRRFRVQFRKLTTTADVIHVASIRDYGRAEFDNAIQGAHGIELGANARGVKLENCWCEGTADGILISGGSKPTRDVTIRNCVVRANNRQGILVGAVHGCLIEGCEVAEIERSGIDFETDDPFQTSHEVVVRNCRIWNPVNQCFSMGGWQGMYNVTIANVVGIDGMANTKAYLDGGAIGLTVLNGQMIRLRGTSRNAADIELRGQDCTVIGGLYPLGVTAATETKTRNDFDGGGDELTLSAARFYVDGIKVTSQQGNANCTLPASSSVGFIRFLPSGDTCPWIGLPGGAGFLREAPLTKAGTPTDADFQAFFAGSPTIANGNRVIDTTNHRAYVRDGGTWRFSSMGSYRSRL